MSTPTGDNDFLHELEAEVETELTLAEASRPEETTGLPPTQWLFDPLDAEREEIGLRGILSASKALEKEARPDESA
ncbi:hypothetical protein [Actinomadura rudentiformis]|uniref:Uncharacterized protein n=1 Tax=Actinomadura rudentiformis TaxID=359158 RepID=A0A6H9YVF7_9ACTN|nr:hypothetical protein [Actinomadura rudentiformis]KAB2352541.1 hypothetical protein F8566_02360 [Actinomadura rudentiformis]